MSNDSYASSTRERLLEDVARLTAEREAALEDARAYQLDRDVAMGGVKGLRAEVERLTAERDAARSAPVIPSDVGRRLAIAEAELRGAAWQRDAVAMHRGEGQPDPADVCRDARAAAVDPYPGEAE
jgi:outer membrane murein-binding lipoprotein Lpp